VVNFFTHFHITNKTPKTQYTFPLTLTHYNQTPEKENT